MMLRRKTASWSWTWVACAWLSAAGCTDTAAPPPLASAAFPLAGEWDPGPPLTETRVGHTATLLTDGRVLVVGGWSSYDATETTELFDPAVAEWTPGDPTSGLHYGHTATLLADGDLLVAGGDDGYYTSRTAERWDAGTEWWTSTGSLTSARSGHVAVRLPDGDVLVAGGSGSSGSPLASVERYDPDTGRWSSAGSMAQARTGHSAALLPSGHVLVVGGWASGTTVLGSAEEYDPVAGTWSPAGTLAVPRLGAGAVRLGTGAILVAGGCSAVSSSGYCNAASRAAELYDPAAGAWSATGSLTNARVWHVSVPLPDGDVLVAAGCELVSSGGYCNRDSTSAERYDPAAGTWSPTGALSEPHEAAAAALLADGRVLLAGGHDGYYATDSVELYDTGSPPACTVCDAAGACTVLAVGAACGVCSACSAAGACAPAGAGSSCGLCGTCDAAGACTVVPDDDPDCGSVDCDDLDTACTDYHDVEAHRCLSAGACKPPNDLATCTDLDFARAAAPCGEGFHEDFEGGTWGWTLDSPWARSRVDAHGGTWSLTDSPIGDSPEDADISATLTEPLSLVGAVSPALVFWHHHAIDDYYGYATVEVDPGDGSWIPVAEYTGILAEWTRETVPLDGFAGVEALRVRFRLMTYYYYTEDGWWLDDVALTGITDPCHECDGAGGCVPSADGTTCPDGDRCNGEEICTAGGCAAAAPLLCDDANACTVDSCDPALGCRNAPEFDGLACSSPLFCDGVCNSGSCIGHAPADCDDGNSCTADACDLTLHACSNEPLADGAPCDDPDPCTIGGVCTAGSCSGGMPVACDDGESCTADWCDPVTGCRTTNVADGTACDDDDVCTTGDTCSAGACGGTPASCTDGDPCTGDDCDPATGCTHAPSPGALCDDGDPATSEDTCNADGVCAGTASASSGCDCRAVPANPGPASLLLLALALLLRPRRRT